MALFGSRQRNQVIRLENIYEVDPARSKSPLPPPSLKAHTPRNRNAPHRRAPSAEERNATATLPANKAELLDFCIHIIPYLNLSSSSRREELNHAQCDYILFKDYNRAAPQTSANIERYPRYVSRQVGGPRQGERDIDAPEGNVRNEQGWMGKLSTIHPLTTLHGKSNFIQETVLTNDAS
ncbi:hypothetical protein C8R44DRAFT_854804 [Mycena epipterygia]|nr:hypothetical protein C8R44DRAFT_854804 [Mycena epipterygia]